MLQWSEAAGSELEEAIRWYDEQLFGLGDRLLLEVVAALALIERFPLAWNPLSMRTRSHRLNRFPYSVVYTVLEDGGLIVVAFAHQHRMPEYWQGRLAGKH